MRTFVQHFRLVTGNRLYSMRELRHLGMTHMINPRGGATLVEVLSEDGEVLSQGYAACSKLDNYNKKLGRLIATGRAMKQVQDA